MKKFTFALVLGLALILALATTALADNGPHGGFTATTEKCASCHRAHSAQGAAYLLISDVETICLSCHDGSGAYTNVVDGIWDTSTYTGSTAGQGEAGYGLFGGGFTNAAMAHTWSGKDGYDATSIAPVPAAVTSTHNHDGIASGTVWGAGDIGPLSAATYVLECTSCHDPHGNAGRADNTSTGTPTASYRLLRFQPSGSNGFEAISGTGTTLTYWNAGNAASTAGITVVDTAATNKWYTVNNNITTDGSVEFYRSRYDAVAGEWTTWSSYIAGRGDYAGRSYVYNRPAAVVTAPGGPKAATNVVTCKDGTGNLPPYPTGSVGAWTVTTYPCGATTGTAFNNAKVNADGTGANAGRAQIGYWCSTCHDRYLANSGSRDNASGDTHYMFRHNSSNSTPCVDCHTAHGTTSVMTNTNANPLTANSSLTTGSILLKTDERSICLKCHGHDVNFSYTP